MLPENASNTIKELIEDLKTEKAQILQISSFREHIEKKIIKNLTESFFNGHWYKTELRNDNTTHSALLIATFISMEQERLNLPNPNMTLSERDALKVIVNLPDERLIIEGVNELITARKSQRAAESSENPSANVVTRSGAKTVSDDGKGPAGNRQ